MLSSVIREHTVRYQGDAVKHKYAKYMLLLCLLDWSTQALMCNTFLSDNFTGSFQPSRERL